MGLFYKGEEMKATIPIKRIESDIKILIKKECANYFLDSGGGQPKIKNYCCLDDTSCLYYSEEEKPSCIYFENSVLPLEPELQFNYRKEFQLEHRSLQKTCKQCGKLFIPKSKKQKYCEECITVRRKEQNRKSIELRRKRAV